MAAALVFGPPAWAVDDTPQDPPEGEPTKAAAGLFEPPVRLRAADGVIDSGPDWGHSGPWVEDVDGDGRRDLVVGDFSGLFRLYRNVGTDREPRFAASVNLKAGRGRGQGAHLLMHRFQSTVRGLRRRRHPRPRLRLV